MNVGCMIFLRDLSCFFQRGCSLRNAGAKVRTKKERRNDCGVGWEFGRVLVGEVAVSRASVGVFEDFG